MRRYPALICLNKTKIPSEYDVSHSVAQDSTGQEKTTGVNTKPRVTWKHSEIF
jgi:hypothetical protein